MEPTTGTTAMPLECNFRKVKMDHWDQNPNQVGEFFQNLTSWSKARAESQRQMESLVGFYSSSINKYINGLIEEASNLKAKHSALAKERDNLLETVIKQNSEIGLLKAKLPIVHNMQVAEEDHENDIQGVDSQNSDIPGEVLLDTEEHAVKRGVQEGCQISSFEEEMKVDEHFDKTMENKKIYPINTQNDLNKSPFNKFNDESTKEQPNFSEEGEKNFKCDRCPYETTLKGHLVRHISRHKTHFCDHCPFKATSKQKLKEHMKEDHDRSLEENKLQCEQCPFKSKLKEALAIHVKKLHLEGKFDCKQCLFKSNQQEKLMTHIEQVHGKTKRGRSCPKPKNNVHEESVNAGTQKADLSHHMESDINRGENVTYNQWGDKHFMCEQCPLGFLRKGMLIRHVKNVH